MVRGLVGVILLALAGCAGPFGDEGDTSPAAAKRAACERSCNRGYDTCADSSGAERRGGSFFGMGAACDRQVRSCLDRCKALTAGPKPEAKDKDNGNGKGPDQP